MKFKNKKTGEIVDFGAVCINAALVSAQNRKRLFWVGKRVGNTYEQVKIELPEDRNIFLKDIIHELRGEKIDEKYFVSDTALKNKKTVIKDLTEKSRALSVNMRGVGNNGTTCIRVGNIGNGGQGDRIYSIEGKSVTLSANGGGRGAKTGLYLITGCASRTYPRIKTPGVERSRQLEVRKDGKANTITTVQSDSMILLNDRVRKLTPIECERLQSLLDNYTQGLSDTQRYKALGNAFNVEVVKHILKNII